MKKKHHFIKRIIVSILSIILLLGMMIIPSTKAEAAVWYSGDPFTDVGRSKKGTQSFKDTEVVNTSNIFINAHMETSFPKDDKSDIAGFHEFPFEGETYYFKVPAGMESYSSIVSLNNKNLTVTVQFILKYDPDKARLVEPSARAYPGKPYYAPNMTEAAVVKEYRAYMAFMAETFNRPECHVDAWVCGNEVNAAYAWNFFGSDCMQSNGSKWKVSNPDLLMDKYTKFYDIVYDAMKSKNKKTRVCICVDHCWTETDQGNIIPTKTFLNMFSAKEGKDKDWCIAYHAYPADLEKPNIWSDWNGHAWNQKNENAQYIDGYNLEILTGYVKNNFGSNHRIMLTEQGFSDKMGEDVQAACLVYTFYKARFDDMIDVFHVLKFPGVGGGYEFKDKALKIWEKLDNGNKADEDWILSQVGPTIGISSFSQITPNWKDQGTLSNELKKFKEENPCYYQGLDYSPVFDFDYFVANNPTVVGYYTLDPVNNPPTFDQMFGYFTMGYGGMDKGLKSHPNFDLENYKATHPELVAKYGEDNRAYYTHFCSESRNANRGQVEAFVKRFYKEIMGREAEQAGLDYYTDILMNKEQTGAQIAYNFVHSPEFMNAHYTDDVVVAKMYDSFFDRKPGPKEYEYWMDKFIDGYTLEQVLSGFTDSGEFQALCDKYGIERGTLGEVQDRPLGQARQLKFGSNENLDEAKVEEYIVRMYKKALGRTSIAPEEIAYWKSSIMTGKDPGGKPYDPASVASDGFLNSKEYLDKNKTDEEFIFDCYQAFFDRTPGTIESDYWLDRMHNNGYTRKRVVLEGFGTSPEFQNLLKTYGFEVLDW